MTLVHITERVDALRDMVRDPESAHAAEDKLYHDFVHSLSHRGDHIGQKARELLSSETIAFPRWCA